MQDIEIINSDSQVRFFKRLWSEPEIVLAKCFSFGINIETGEIVADIKSTFKKAIFEFVKRCFKNFNESISEEPRRNQFFERLEGIYATYYTEGCFVGQKNLPYYDQLYTHQKDALNESFYKQRMLLAFSMGTGKSIISASISRLHNIKRTVIMCPAAVKWNWFDDLTKKFGFNQIYFTMLDAAKNRRVITNFGERFVIVNYDIISKFEEHICREDVGHFILDEVHFCKNTNSNRSKNVRRILEKFPNARITLMSGSPIKNRVDDVFNYLRMTGHELGLNHKKFLEQFTIRAHGKGGERVTGGKNLEDLHTKLSNFMLRKTKEECVDLPPKVYLSYKFELDDYLTEYDKIIREMSQNRTMSSVTGNIHSLNIITSKAKHKGIVELAENLIDSGEKVVIFGGYKEPMSMLQEHFGDRCVKVDGSVDSFTRNEHVKRFIADDSCVVFLGNWQAAGVGINLVNSSNFIVQSFPLTPAELHQGMDRLDRIGQKHSVNIHYTFCEGSIDEHIYNILMEKEGDANAVIDPGKEVVLRENIMEILIKKLLKREDVTIDYDFSAADSKGQEKTFTSITGDEDEQSYTGDVEADTRGPKETLPPVEIQQRFDDVSGPAENGVKEFTEPGYHLMLDTTGDHLLILNEQEFNDVSQTRESELLDYIDWHTDPNFLIMKGRHYRQAKTCSFDERYIPNVSVVASKNTLPPLPTFI